MQCIKCESEDIIEGRNNPKNAIYGIRTFKCKKCNYKWYINKMPCETCGSFNVEKFGLKEKSGYIDKVQRYHCRDCDALWVDVSSARKKETENGICEQCGNDSVKKDGILTLKKGVCQRFKCKCCNTTWTIQI